jgi:SAM-dependent methyltransferase
MAPRHVGSYPERDGPDAHHLAVYLRSAAQIPRCRAPLTPTEEEMTLAFPGFFQGTEMPTGGWWQALWPDPAGVIAAVGVKPGMEVIDLCSGDGWFTCPIAQIARHVVAIEINPDILEGARRRLAKTEMANCDFVAGDANALPALVQFPADFVFMANAFHGVPDQPRLACAVCSTLKLGGQFAIVNWHRRPREETRFLGEPRGPTDELRLSPETTIQAVEPSGLKFGRLIELPPYHYGVVFLKE